MMNVVIFSLHLHIMISDPFGSGGGDRSISCSLNIDHG